MRIPINLATEPFRKDRPMQAAFIAGSVVLTLSLGAQVFMIVNGAGLTVNLRGDAAVIFDNAVTLASEKFISRNRDVAVRFMRALYVSGRPGRRLKMTATWRT